MAIPQADVRSDQRKQKDEDLAAEPELPTPALPPGVQPRPLESLLRRRPLAVLGIVENGLIRPLDPTVKLPEHARVIIVAAESA